MILEDQVWCLLELNDIYECADADASTYASYQLSVVPIPPPAMDVDVQEIGYVQNPPED